MPIICPDPSCGTENLDGSAYCEVCGMKLPEVVLTPPPPLPPQPDPFPKPAYTGLRLVLKLHGAPSQHTFDLIGERSGIGKFDPSVGPIEVDLSSIPNSDLISRRHAEIYREGSVWKIRDINSTNGVFVKKAGQGQFSTRLIAPVEIADGDEIGLGNAVFIVRSI